MAEIGQGVKVLLQSFAPDFITYVLPQAHDIGPQPAELATGPQLLPDAVFQGIRNDKSCIFQPEHLQELEGVLGLFASRHFGPQPVLDMLRMHFLLKVFPLYHVLTEMANEEGLAKGMERGMEQCVAQGRLDVLRQSAHHA